MRDHSAQVKEVGTVVLESGGTALVLAKTIVSATNLAPVHRDATYVFRREVDGSWRCAIDNSYGHELLTVSHAPDAGGLPVAEPRSFVSTAVVVPPLALRPGGVSRAHGPRGADSTGVQSESSSNSGAATRSGAAR